MKLFLFVIRFMVMGVLLFSSACATYNYKNPPRTSRNPPTTAGHYREVGLASWYGPGFYGRKTASGEKFKKHDLTCAHRKLPFGTPLLVTNLENGKNVEVVVNDRGPFIKNKIVDLSYAAAKEIGMLGAGSAKVELKTLVAEEDRLLPQQPNVHEDYFGPTDAPFPTEKPTPTQDSAQSIENLIEGIQKR